MYDNQILAEVSQLATGLRLTLDDEDPYALFMLAGASDVVRATARQPGWVFEDPEPGQTVAPEIARNVTLWAAMRAYTNPQNLQNRTSGPISHSFRDVGVVGLELRPSEIAFLDEFNPASDSGGLWILPLTRGKVEVPIYLADHTYGAGRSKPVAYLSPDEPIPALGE